MNSATSRPAYCASQRRRQPAIFFWARLFCDLSRNTLKFLWTCPSTRRWTDIVAERFDAGIRLGEQIERDMIAVRVTDELPVVVAGSPAYFAQRGKPKSPRT